VRADADDYRVDGQHPTVCERDLLGRDGTSKRLGVGPEMEFDVVLGVRRASEAGHLGPEWYRLAAQEHDTTIESFLADANDQRRLVVTHRHFYRSGSPLSVMLRSGAAGR
jgi:hypothetical protein